MDLYPFDDDYVRRLREGDRPTEEHFFRYFQAMLPNKLRRRGVKSPQDVDDIIQETYMRVLSKVRSEDGIRDGRKFGSFVNSVCNNVHLEWMRGTLKFDRLDEGHEETDPDPLPDDMVVTEETKQRVRQILREMAPRDAEILSDLFLEERDKDEICRKFNVTREYLRVILHRAKEKFLVKYRLPDVPRRPTWPKHQVPAGQPQEGGSDRPPNETDSGKPSLKS